LLLSGNAATSLLTLIRNLLVARMIPVADYGVAATFAIVMAIVEMSSTLGLKQQIVQAKDGNAPRFQAALQGFQVLRGVLAGLLLFLIAAPLAAFFGIPEAAWAYQVLAMVPVLGAFGHFDIYRLHRQMRFGPMLWAHLIPALVSVLLVWPLVLWFGDWRVMLWSILAQAALALAAGHLLAERRYQLAWDPAIIAGLLRYGWPLLINSALMFAVFQGDKMIVGRLLGMEALGLFAMGVTLTLTPTLVLAKTSQNLFLPRVSQTMRQAEQDLRLMRFTMEATMLYGVSVMVFFILFGDLVIRLLLTEAYAPLGQIIGPLAILFGLRIFKSGLSTISLASARTLSNLMANLPRIASLGIAYWVLLQGGTLMQVIWIGILAELAGYLVFITMLFRHVRPILPKLLPSYAVIALIVLHELTVTLWAPGFLPDLSLRHEQLLVAVSFLVFLLSLSLFRALGQRLLQR